MTPAVLHRAKLGSSRMTFPLQGYNVVMRAGGVAATYAGRLLGTMGADVLLIEPAEGSPLRREPPFLPREDGSVGEMSALFAYLSAGMTSATIDLVSPEGSRA